MFTSQIVLRLSTTEVVVSWDPLIAQTLHTQQTLSKLHWLDGPISSFSTLLAGVQ